MFAILGWFNSSSCPGNISSEGDELATKDKRHKATRSALCWQPEILACVCVCV